MAVTIDKVYALLTAVNSKIDALITEEGILMSQTSDIQAAADLITAEVAQLNDSYTQLSGLVGQLRAQGVDPAVLDQFDQALSTLKPSVDRIASITPQPAPAPPQPAPTPPPSPAPAQASPVQPARVPQDSGQQGGGLGSAQAAQGQPGAQDQAGLAAAERSGAQAQQGQEAQGQQGQQAQPGQQGQQVQGQAQQGQQVQPGQEGQQVQGQAQQAQPQQPG